MTILHKLQPGLIHIKQGLSALEQNLLTKSALDRVHEFYKIDGTGQMVLNQTPVRGRIFGSLDKFPRLISELGLKCVMHAQQHDPSIKSIEATHLILLYYKTLAQEERYIQWHQDLDPNDGEEHLPVVSFAIGDSCDFLVCNRKPRISQEEPISNPANLSHRVLFESGDVLIFGGASRYIHHAIYKIHQNTAPGFLPFCGGRLNFTLRHAPKIKGLETMYSSENFQSVYKRKSLI